MHARTFAKKNSLSMYGTTWTGARRQAVFLSLRYRSRRRRRRRCLVTNTSLITDFGSFSLSLYVCLFLRVLSARG